VVFYQVIDEVLQQFDRKTIKRFLKRDVDGNSKGTVAEQMKSVSTKLPKLLITKVPQLTPLFHHIFSVSQSIYKGEGYKER